MKNIPSFFIFYFFCIFYASSSNLDTKSQEIIKHVARDLEYVVLPDGMNIYGKTLSETPQFKWDFIDKTKQAKYESAFWLALCNPIKHEGIFWNTYYTPEEIIERFEFLLNPMSRFNESLMSFLQSTFEDGCIYMARLPGLKKQPERAELYKSLKFCARKYKEKIPYKITDFLETATFHYKKIRFTYYMNALQVIFQQEQLERKIKKSLSMIEIEYGTGILLLSKQELIERAFIENKNVITTLEKKCMQDIDIMRMLIQSFLMKKKFKIEELQEFEKNKKQLASLYLWLDVLGNKKDEINPKKENQTKTKPHEKSE